MKFRTLITALTSGLLVFSAGLLIFAAPREANPDAGRRQQERSEVREGNLKADDKELARKVRQAIADDLMLSPQAKTILVKVKGGKVDLSGFVADEAEKDKIESKAKTIAGTGNVTSKLEIRKA